MMDKIAASKIARQTVTDIVQLMLAGRLLQIEILSKDFKFRSALVDPHEVRRVAAAIKIPNARGTIP